MEKLNDVWQYLCKGTQGYNISRFYVENPNETALAFWHGVLTVLEIEGKITNEQGMRIWDELTKG